MHRERRDAFHGYVPAKPDPASSPVALMSAALWAVEHIHVLLIGLAAWTVTACALALVLGRVIEQADVEEQRHLELVAS